MGRETLHVMATASASPDALWPTARDFCGAWHPFIATIEEERGERGAVIRRFTAHGEDTVYREQRTYLSNSDRVIAYTHLEGIKGASRYNARLTLSPRDGGGTAISWTAEIEAPGPRASDIAKGTQPVFEAGIEAIQSRASLMLAENTPPQPMSVEDRPLPLTETILPGTPRLGLTHTARKGDTLALFLHGIGGARHNWARQLTQAGHRMTACALDLRGYGDSSLGFEQSTVEDYCDDILRVMVHFGAKRLVLVGLSYGSWIATSFAMRHPEKLAGLVLSGGCTGMSEAGPEEREAFRVSREVPLNAGQVPADFAPAVVKVIAGPHAPEAVRAELLASMSAIPAATYRDALVCFTSPRERFDFARLTMPTLLMTGEHDRLAPPSEIRAVAGRILDAAPHMQNARPDVQYETIPGVGHVCNVEGADAYTAALIPFLARLIP
jgi:pimeloyl-ACP methyl ester carboxylesterase